MPDRNAGAILLVPIHVGHPDRFAPLPILRPMFFQGVRKMLVPLDRELLIQSKRPNNPLEGNGRIIRGRGFCERTGSYLAVGR